MTKYCARCKERFHYKRSDTWVDRKGYNYDTELVKCKNCGCINIVKYIEYDLQEREQWYYEY